MNKLPLKYVEIAALTAPAVKAPWLSESDQTRLFALFLGLLSLFLLGWLGATHSPNQPFVLDLLQLVWGFASFVLLCLSIIQLATTD